MFQFSANEIVQKENNNKREHNMGTLFTSGKYINSTLMEIVIYKDINVICEQVVCTVFLFFLNEYELINVSTSEKIGVVGLNQHLNHGASTASCI